MSTGELPYVEGRLLSDRAKKNAAGYSFSSRTKPTHEMIGIALQITLLNRPEYLFIWSGWARVGAIEVPINTSFKVEFSRHLIDQSDSKMLFIDREWLDRIKLIQDDLKKLEKVAVLGGMTPEDKQVSHYP